MSTRLELHPWGPDGLGVLQRNNTPEMTVFLGGPETDEQIDARQAKYLRLCAEGEARMFTIHVDDASEPVGSVGYWQATWQGEDVYETGWSVATAHQGHGYAARALAACLRDAAEQGDRDAVLAFPRTDNTSSNALCRRAGFVLQGEEDFEYPKGHPIRVNAWKALLTSL